MKTHVALIPFVVSALLSVPVHADHHKGGGFKSIFDGKTLTGWKSSVDNPAAFSVEQDGCLKVTGNRAHLFYVGEGGFTFARPWVSLDFACYQCHKDPISGEGGTSSQKTMAELSAKATAIHN